MTPTIDDAPKYTLQRLAMTFWVKTNRQLMNRNTKLLCPLNYVSCTRTFKCVIRPISYYYADEDGTLASVVGGVSYYGFYCNNNYKS